MTAYFRDISVVGEAVVYVEVTADPSMSVPWGAEYAQISSAKFATRVRCTCTRV
ncbi:hypothetical protein ACWDPV_10760 [Gordonia sp. NPDC003504]